MNRFELYPVRVDVYDAAMPVRVMVFEAHTHLLNAFHRHIETQEDFSLYNLMTSSQRCY
jgi:hypothetical protein